MTPPQHVQSEPNWPEATHRRAATIANLVHQYVTIVVMIVNGLVLPPLYLKYIGLGLYGAWLASGDIVAWLTVMEAGVNDLIRQRSARAYGERDVAALGEVIGTGLAVNTAIALLPFAVGVCLAPMVPPIFGVTGGEADALRASFAIASLAVTFMLIASGPGAVQQGLQRNISHCVIYVISSVIGIAGTVVMLVSGWGLVSIPAGLLLRWVIGAVLYWAYIVVFVKYVLRIRPTVSRSQARTFAHLTGWTLSSRLARALGTNSDRFLVGAILGKEITPILSFTARGWEVVRMFVERVGMAFMPGLAHLHGEGNVKQLRAISLKLVRVVAVAMAIGCGGVLAMNRGFMTLWLGQDRSNLFAGAAFNNLLGGAMFLMVMALTLRQVLFAMGKVKETSAAELINSLVRTGLLLALLSALGLVAVPITIILAVPAVMVWYFVRLWARQLSISAKELLVELRRGAVVLLPVVLLAWVWGHLPQPWLATDKAKLVRWLLLLLSGAGYVAAAVAIVMILDKGSRQFVAAPVKAVLAKVGIGRGRRAGKGGDE